MGEILEIVEEKSGGKCYYSDRYTLDHLVPPEYQDKQEEFKSDKIFETDNKAGRNISLSEVGFTSPIFKYFLDGSRRTYKIVDFATTDNKFLPIVAGQIGAAVCYRKEKKLRKHKILRKNVLAIPDRVGGAFEEIRADILKVRKHNLSIDEVVKYQYKERPERPFENLAIAKIQVEMLNMEIDLISSMVHSNLLRTDEMLIIDGSLQFSSVKENKEHIFENVIGISKTFNPHLTGILKTKKKEIGYHLTDLDFGERTAVFVYESYSGGRERNLRIGAWYLRIHDKKFLRNPLDGIIKIEKVAVTKKEKEYGFESDLIDEVSRAILLERNVTCYGKDERWANHLYPIYLTEQFLKNSFESENYFLNMF